MAIRRLAHRAGVAEVSDDVCVAAADVLKIFLVKVIRDAVAYTEQAEREIVTAKDVVNA